MSLDLLYCCFCCFCPVLNDLTSPRHKLYWTSAKSERSTKPPLVVAGTHQPNRPTTDQPTNAYTLYLRYSRRRRRKLLSFIDCDVRPPARAMEISRSSLLLLYCCSTACMLPYPTPFVRPSSSPSNRLTVAIIVKPRVGTEDARLVHLSVWCFRGDV